MNNYDFIQIDTIKRQSKLFAPTNIKPLHKLQLSTFLNKLDKSNKEVYETNENRANISKKQLEMINTLK